MRTKTRPAPHIHYHENTRVLMADVILAMAVVYAMTFYYYRERVIVLAAASVAAAYITDVLCVILRDHKPHIRDLSAIVTGLMIPLLLPASIPVHVVVAASVFAIMAAKQPFGGVGHNLFNPAAAGAAFAIVSFPSSVFSYPLPFEKLPITITPDISLTNSPAFTMQIGGVPQYSWVEMALGNFPGPMGCTNILVILACLLYLVLRGTVRWQTPIPFLLTFAGLCALFPRAGMTSLETVMYECMSGCLLFGAVFMLGDPVTSVQRGWSKFFYGMLAALVFFLFRRYSRLEEEFPFALLLMNSGTWLFDIVGEKIAGWIRRRSVETGTSEKISKKA